MKKKFYIITTVPISLIFFKGQISILKKEFDVEIISSKGDNFDLTLKNEGVKGRNIEMKREISVFSDIKSLFQLVLYFYRTKPAIVHGSTPKAGLLSMIAAWITRVPTRIYYIHGLRYEGAKEKKRKLLILMEKISCFFASDIFAVSHGVKKTLISDSITNKKINIIANGSVNGINTKYFSPQNSTIPDLKKQYNIKPSDFIFGFVGRFTSDKGINELVSAFIEINKINQNTKLLLVGDFEDNLDPLNVSVKNEINTNNNIINAGYQTDIRPFLKMMNVFVFPSYREGFGVSLMEAAAMKVPAISSDIIGCNEIIKHNYNGLLIPPKSIDCLSKAMLKIQNSKKAHFEMSENTRPFVIGKYDQEMVWKETLLAYKKISTKVKK